MAGKTSGLTINVGCVREGSKQINGKTWQELESHSCGISDGNDVTSEGEGRNQVYPLVITVALLDVKGSHTLSVC